MTEDAFFAWLNSLGVPGAISLDMSLAEASVDSMVLLEWAVTIEERTNRTLSDDLLDSLGTVGDLYHFYNVLNHDMVQS